jgi:ankyrin repeat protein
MRIVSENTKNNTSSSLLSSFPSKNNTHYSSNKSVRTKRQANAFLDLLFEDKRSVLREKILFQGRERTVREVLEVPVVDCLLNQQTLSVWQLKILGEIAARRESPTHFRYLSMRTAPFTGKELSVRDLLRAFKHSKDIFVFTGQFGMAQAKNLFNVESVCEYSQYPEFTEPDFEEKLLIFKENLLSTRILLLGEGTTKKRIERFEQIKSIVENINLANPDNPAVQTFLIHRESRMLVIGSLPPHIESSMTYRDIREPVTVENLREAFKDEKNLFALSGTNAQRAAEIFNTQEARVILFFDLNHYQHNVFLTQRIVALEGGKYEKDEAQFKTLCAYYPDQRIHLIQEKEGKLIWQRYRDPDFYPERNFRQPVLKKEILSIAARRRKEKSRKDLLKNMVFAVQGIREDVLIKNFGLSKEVVSTQIPNASPDDTGPFIFILSDDQPAVATVASQFEQLKKTFGEGKLLYWLKADSTGNDLIYYHSPKDYESLLPYVEAEHLLFQKEFSEISTKLLIFSDEREQGRTTALTAAIQQRLNNPEHANDWAIRIYLPDISSEINDVFRHLISFDLDGSIARIVDVLCTADSKGLEDSIAKSLLTERLKLAEDDTGDDNRARVVIIFHDYQNLDLPSAERACLFLKFLKENTRAVFWITVDDLFIESVTHLQEKLSDNIYILDGINKDQATKYLEDFWKKDLALKLTQKQLTSFNYQFYINKLFEHFSRSHLDLSELRFLAEVLGSDVQRLCQEELCQKSSRLFEAEADLAESKLKFKRTEHAQLISDFVQLRFEKLKLRHNCPTDCDADIKYFTKKLSLIALNKIFGFDERVIELFFPKLNFIPKNTLELQDAILHLLLLSPKDVNALNKIGLIYSKDDSIRHNTVFLHDDFISYFAIERIGDKMQSALVNLHYEQKYKNEFFNFIFQCVLNVESKKSLRDMFNHYFEKNIKFKALFSQEGIGSSMVVGLIRQIVTNDLFPGLYLAIKENLPHIVDFITIGPRTDPEFGKPFFSVILKTLDSEQGDGLLHALAHYDRSAFVELFIGTKIHAIGSPSAALAIKNKRGETPLHAAVRENRISVMKAFLDPLQNEISKTDDLDALFNVFKAFNKNGDPPIHMAVREGSEKMLECLLEALRTGKVFEDHRELQKKIILFPNKDGDSILSLAVTYQQLNKIKSILNNLASDIAIAGIAGELLLTPNRFGKLPLHFGVNGKQLEIIKALLDGSNNQEVIANQLTFLDSPSLSSHQRDVPSYTPLTLAMDSTEVFKMLLGSIKDKTILRSVLLPPQGDSILIRAIKYSCNQVVNFLLLQYNDLRHEDPDLLKELLDNPASQDGRMLFPLHYALSLSALSHKALSLRKLSGEVTKASQEISARNKLIIQDILWLINSDVKTYGDILLLTDDWGDTVLHTELRRAQAQYATEIFRIVENHPKILEELLLIKNKFKKHDQDAGGRTVLQVAISSGHKTQVELFLNALRKSSKVPSDYLVLLAEQLRVTDHLGENALHIAAKRAHSTMMEVLLNKLQYLSEQQILNILQAKDSDKKTPRTPFEIAISIGFLSKAHRPSDKDKLSIIHKLAKASDAYANIIAEFLKAIKKHEESFYNTLLTDTKSYLLTPIHYAAILNHEKTLRVLFYAMMKPTLFDSSPYYSGTAATERGLTAFCQRDHEEWALPSSDDLQQVLEIKDQILRSLADDLLGLGKGMLHLAIKVGNQDALDIMLNALLENMAWREYVVGYQLMNNGRNPEPGTYDITPEEKAGFLDRYKARTSDLSDTYSEIINDLVLDEALPKKDGEMSPLMQVIVSQGEKFDSAINMIEALVNSGVDVDLVNKKGLSAVTLAVEQKYFCLSEQLIVKYGMSVKQLTSKQLLKLQKYAEENLEALIELQDDAKATSETLIKIITDRLAELDVELDAELDVSPSCVVTEEEPAGPSGRGKRDVKCVLTEEEIEKIRSDKNKELYPELNLEDLEIDLKNALTLYTRLNDEARGSLLMFLYNARFTDDTNPEYTRYVKQLDNTHNRLQRAKKFASLTLTAEKIARTGSEVQITRTLIVHLLQGDWDDVGIDLAFLFSGPALMKAHELVGQYTEELLRAPEQLKWMLERMKLGPIADQLIQDGKLVHEALFRHMLSKALATSMRCLSSWTLPFMIYQLASDIKQLKNQIDPKERSATERSIAIDSLFVALDGLSFAVGMGELMGLLAGVSELLGPLGLVGLGAMLAMQIYEATEYVQQIEETAHLDTQEKVRTWLRTLALMPPELEVQERLTLAQGYKALIQQILNLFGNHPEIASYTTAGLVAQGDCDTVQPEQVEAICRLNWWICLFKLLNPLMKVETQISNQYAQCQIPLTTSKETRTIEHDDRNEQINVAWEKVGLQSPKYNKKNGTVSCFESDVPENECRHTIVLKSNIRTSVERHHIIALGRGANNTVHLKHKPDQPDMTVTEIVSGSNQAQEYNQYEVDGNVMFQLVTQDGTKQNTQDAQVDADAQDVIKGTLKADPQAQETTLDFSGFAPNKTVQVKMQGIEGFVTHEGYLKSEPLFFSGIRNFIGRTGDTDRIDLSEFCGSFRIYGGGGYAGYQPGPAPDDWHWEGYARGMDEITISSGNCTVNGAITVGAHTSVFIENMTPNSTLTWIIQTKYKDERNSGSFNYFYFTPEHQSQNYFKIQIESPEEIISVEPYGLPNQKTKLDFLFKDGEASITNPPAGGRYIFPFMEVKIDQNKIVYSPIRLEADEYQSVRQLVETYRGYSERFNTIVMGTRSIQKGDQTLKETIITTVDPHKVLPTDPTADIVRVYGGGIYSLTPRQSENRIPQQIIIHPGETESKTLIVQAITQAIKEKLDSRSTVKMSIQPSQHPQDLELKIFVDRNTIGASKLLEDVRYIVRLKQGVQWYSQLEIIDGSAQNVADRNGHRIAQQRILSVRYDQDSQSYIVELKPLRRTPEISLWIPTLSKNAVIDLSDKELAAFKFFKIDADTIALIEIHHSGDRPLILLFHKDDPYLSGLNIRFNQSTKEISSMDEILSEAGNYQDYRYSILKNLFEEIVRNTNTSQQLGVIASKFQHSRQYQALKQPKVMTQEQSNTQHATQWQSYGQIMLASVGVAGTAALTFLGIKFLRRHPGFQALPLIEPAAAVMLSAGSARLSVGYARRAISFESGSKPSEPITALARYQAPEPLVLTIYPTKIIGAGGSGLVDGVSMAVCDRVFKQETMMMQIMIQYFVKPLMRPTLFGITSVALGYPTMSASMFGMQAAQFLIINGLMRGALNCLGGLQVNQFLISLALYLTLHWYEEGMDDLNLCSKVINCMLQVCAWMAGYVGGTRFVDGVARILNLSQESGEESNHPSQGFFRGNQYKAIELTQSNVDLSQDRSLG